MTVAATVDDVEAQGEEVAPRVSAGMGAVPDGGGMYYGMCPGGMAPTSMHGMPGTPMSPMSGPPMLCSPMCSGPQGYPMMPPMMQQPLPPGMMLTPGSFAPAGFPPSHAPGVSSGGTPGHVPQSQYAAMRALELGAAGRERLAWSFEEDAEIVRSVQARRDRS